MANIWSSNSNKTNDHLKDQTNNPGCLNLISETFKKCHIDDWSKEKKLDKLSRYSPCLVMLKLKINPTYIIY
jgi:hypothetical protein